MTVNVTYREPGAVVPASTTVKNSPLSNAEIDGNFKSVKDAVEILETQVSDPTLDYKKITDAVDVTGAKEIQRRRGTTLDHVAFTGAQGEITVDTDKKVVVVHDGVTPGGFPLVSAKDLAAPSGSSLVGYMPAGTGAVATTVQSKLRESVSVKDFGAVGDGLNDDTAAIKAAIAVCKANKQTITGEGEFKLTGSVDFRAVCVDMPNAAFTVAHAGIGLVVGGNSANPNNPPQHIGTVNRTVGADSATTPTVRVIGSSCQHVTVEYANYVQLYADTSFADSYAVQYSTFNFKNCVTLEITNNATTTGDYRQYINENTFYLNAIQNMLINSATVGGLKYHHNHNTFHGGSFEAAAVINMQVGSSNYVHNIRAEDTTGTGGLVVTFAAGVRDCIVSLGWVSSGHRYPSDINPTVINNGEMCAVQHLYDIHAPVTPIVGFDYQNLLNIGTEYNVIGVSDVTVNATNMAVGNFGSFYDSGLIPIVGENAVFEVNAFGVTVGGIRTKVIGYDANKDAITPAANQVKFDGSPNKQFGEYDTGVNTVTSAKFYVLDQNCRYISISVIAGGEGLTFGSFYLGCRVPDVAQRKKLEAATFTTTRGSLALYAAGTWTPVDKSPAGLTLTVNNATYTRVGRMVFIEMDVTYPTTADGNALKIGGLPYAASYRGIGAVMSNAAIEITAHVDGFLQKTITLHKTGGNYVGNSDVSGKYVRLSVAYVAV